MKLTNILYRLISEDTGPEGRFVTSFVNDGFLINLFATFHQWSERKGSESLNDVVRMYEHNFTYNSKYYDRIGVPNKLINEIFTVNFRVIKREMLKSKLEKSNNIVLFTKKVGESLRIPEYMEFAEFILFTEDFKNYKIITSVFSNSGNYLKSVEKKRDITRIVLQN